MYQFWAKIPQNMPPTAVAFIAKHPRRPEMAISSNEREYMGSSNEVTLEAAIKAWATWMEYEGRTISPDGFVFNV